MKAIGIMVAISMLLSSMLCAAPPLIASISNQQKSAGTTYTYTPALSAGGTVSWEKTYGPDDL